MLLSLWNICYSMEQSIASFGSGASLTPFTRNWIPLDLSVFAINNHQLRRDGMVLDTKDISSVHQHWLGCVLETWLWPMWFQWPLIPVSVALEDDRLPTDDDITSSNNETEQNDVASDENIVSKSDIDDDWTVILGVFHDLKKYFMQWTLQYIICLLAMDWLYLLCAWILYFLYYFLSTAKYVRSEYI